MALNIMDSRHRIKRSIITGSTPTFNLQEDFTDGTFLTTDIRFGELYWNGVDNRLFIAGYSGISEINVTATGATNDFCPEGIRASAVSGCSPVTMYDGSTKVAHFASSAFTLALNQQIRSDNGNALIEMDYGGAADKIFLSPDDTFNNYMLFNGPSNSFELFVADDIYIESAVDIATVGFDNNLLLMKGTTNVVGIYALTTSSSSSDFNTSEGGIAIGDSSANLTTPSSFVNAQVIINSRSSIFNSGVTSSAIIGGISITADTSETVYIPSLSIQDGKGISFGTGKTEARIELLIGDWDMDTDGTTTVSHNLTASQWKTIRDINIIIRNDTDTSYYDMSYPFAASQQVGCTSFTSTVFNLERRAAQDFDSTDFDSTEYNRGFITFVYDINA